MILNCLLANKRLEVFNIDPSSAVPPAVLFIFHLSRCQIISFFVCVYVHVYVYKSFSVRGIDLLSELLY